MPPSLRTIIATSLFALASCTSSPAPRREPLSPATAEEHLGCTPLLLGVRAGPILGSGSGVLVHPRLVLTANHIVPPDPAFIIASTAPGESTETIPITRVYRGTGGEEGKPAWSDDWAILVLDRPFHDLKAAPARRLLPAGDPWPPARGPILIAGFPFAPGGSPSGGPLDPLEREAVLFRTTLVPLPAGTRAERGVCFAAGGDTSPRRHGSSGGPAFTPAGDTGPPVLMGVYLGVLERRFLGLLVGRELAIGRPPVEAIQRAIDELGPERGPQ